MLLFYIIIYVSNRKDHFTGINPKTKPKLDNFKVEYFVYLSSIQKTYLYFGNLSTFNSILKNLDVTGNSKVNYNITLHVA